MLEHAMYRRIRLNFYRLHCKFVSGNDKRADGGLSIITEDGTLLGMPRYFSEPPIKSARPNRI
jgi:hypothetical protein